MKIESIPQDDENFYEGHRRAVYAVGENGNYVKAHSKGWNVETYFTGLAVDDVNQRTQKALTLARQGVLSPIAVHMAKWKLDPDTVASQTGFFRWQVKRHMRQQIYKCLPAHKLQRYADLFCISLETLNKIDEV